MTGVPAPKPKAYRPWREIAAELASAKDPQKAWELAHELTCALKEQMSRPEEEKAAVSTTEQFSLILHLP